MLLTRFPEYTDVETRPLTFAKRCHCPMDWLSAWLSGPLIPFRGTAPNRPNVVSFRIPAAPPVSSCTQPPTSPHPFVSSCIRWVPRMRDTAVTSTGLATEPHPSAFGTVGEGRHGLEPRASRLRALSAV